MYPAEIQKYLDDKVCKNKISRYGKFTKPYLEFLDVCNKHNFEPTRYGGQTLEDAVSQTNRTKLYDGIKTINAKLMGMRMIRIAYTRLEDIDAILSTEIDSNNDNFLGIYK